MSNQCITQVYLISILKSCLWLWSLQSVLGQGVYIQFKGSRLSNNSDINITDIGVGDASVHCVTDKSDCCRRGDGGAPRGLGEWYFPNNGSAVGIGGDDGQGGSFYRDRGEGVVHLHRRHNVMMPTGPFCCVVPDASGMDQRMCIIATMRPFETTSIPVNMIGSSISIQPSPTTSIESSVASNITATNTVTPKIVNSVTVSEISTEPTTEVDITTTRSMIPTDSSSMGTPDCTEPEPGPKVGLYLNGIQYSNNSIISFEQIGENHCALLCYTNFTECCQMPKHGEWFYPNRSAIRKNISNDDLYRDRGPSVVRLHRRNNAAQEPTGEFCCEIPFSMWDEVNKIFCIAVYNREDEVEVNLTIQGGLLNCFTRHNLIVNSMEILDANGQRIRGPVENTFFVSYDVDTTINATYYCRVNSTLGSQNLSILVLSTEYETEEIITQSASPIVTKQSSITTPNIPIIPVAASAATVLVLLLIILILACIIILRRKRTQSTLAQKYGTLNTALDIKDHHDKTKPEKLELEEATDNSKVLNCDQREDKPIPLVQFVEHVDQMHADRDDLFEDEFGSLSTSPQAAHDVSSIPYNDEKNRFLNIFPYDYNRVKLKEIPDVEGSDYINASYLNGYYKQKAYIAAQGPLPNSLEDFWRMIWEQKLPTIVMLTKCFEERKKCECYWPENKEETLIPGHELSIKLISSIPFSDFIIRKMSIKSGLEPDTPPLEVTQLHFTAWPDHGVPSNTSVMLNIIRRVRKIHPYSDPQPLLVHCSAGVGRTGTFIVLDSMLERMKSEKSFNIFEFVQQLREERVFMVQSLAQYMFIHDALKELILCGETEILAPNLGIVINKLSKVKDGTSGFELQFQILKKLCPKLENDSCSCAKTECNVKKNRYPDKIPCDGSSRTTLRWNGEQGSDYINASFIDGYKQRRAYIATQGPLESTVNDFWRMIWEQKSCCIVMLCQLEENDKEMSSHYWPTEDEPITYGKLMIKKLSHEKHGDIIVRKFEIDEKKQSSLVDLKTAFTVTQFQFLVWKEDEIPPIASHLIELVDNANKVQMGSGNRPMVVMCNDGVGRTGTFICIHAQLERLKTEGVVDFFQFVKSAGMQRPGLILSVGQYELCHSAVLHYLQSVDAYANFKDVV